MYHEFVCTAAEKPSGVKATRDFKATQDWPSDLIEFRTRVLCCVIGCIHRENWMTLHCLSFHSSSAGVGEILEKLLLGTIHVQKPDNILIERFRDSFLIAPSNRCHTECSEFFYAAPLRPLINLVEDDLLALLIDDLIWPPLLEHIR